ncbi:Vacuolar-sorting receptor 1 [Cymbomonas tetramitiformis]|uniref:Vacuolar-sorting receptor 1 n=1 Tax=Cymbomonas tetramitiformis TaxID=36881 RepID=A0AAE0GFB8_9CHLO|nr:Vacuolar-sorting receptor 1 [Cymbomonas tetramitiformis]|eukprot:gene2096-2796_t
MVLQAQEYGHADAVMLIGEWNNESWKKNLQTLYHSESVEDVQTSQKINVPVVIVPFYDQNQLILKSTTSQLVVDLDFEKSQNYTSGDLVTVDIYWKQFGCTSHKCMQDDEEFRKVLHEVLPLSRSGEVTIEPHYWVYYCSENCEQHCLSDGKYCSQDPESDHLSGYTGRDVIVQNLISLCVFDVANKTGRPWQWIMYWLEHKDRCALDSANFHSNCSGSVLRGIGVDVEDVKACVSDVDGNHPLLDRDRENIKTNNLVFSPEVVANDAVYRGSVRWDDIFNFICAAFGFTFSDRPAVCRHGGNVCDEEMSDFCAAMENGASKCEAVQGSFQCVCPDGYTADVEVIGGKEVIVGQCQDIDECDRSVCTGHDMTCKNFPGTYDCVCNDDNAEYVHELEACITRSRSPSLSMAEICGIVVGTFIGLCALTLVIMMGWRRSLLIALSDFFIQRQKDMEGEYESAVLREKDMADSGSAVREIVQEAFDTELNQLEASSKKEIATNV